MKQIVHKINNKNYVLVAFELTEKIIDDFEKNIKNSNGIVQTIKVKNSFWNGKTICVKVLIPEENILAFNKIVTE